MAVIEASQLSKSYGPVKALSNVSFRVERGEVIGLLGPNGAGKTTLMKVLTGYLQPDRGSARVAGSDITSDPLGAQAHIGYLPENAPLYRDMLVQDYLQTMAEMRGVPMVERKRLLSQAIYATGLEDYLTRRISELSKGYRQRVGIAQAILHRPELLILDEPTTGLDPTQIVEIRSLIRRLSENATVVLSTHILSEVELTCERALVISQGELRADAPLAELSRSQNAVLVAIEEAATGVRTHLKTVEGIDSVEEVEKREGYRLWRVCGDGEDLAPRVYDGLRQTKWRIAELRPEMRSLESVFRELADTDAQQEPSN